MCTNSDKILMSSCAASLAPKQKLKNTACFIVCLFNGADCFPIKMMGKTISIWSVVGLDQDYNANCMSSKYTY